MTINSSDFGNFRSCVHAAMSDESKCFYALEDVHSNLGTPYHGDMLRYLVDHIDIRSCARKIRFLRFYDGEYSEPFHRYAEIIGEEGIICWNRFGDPCFPPQRGGEEFIDSMFMATELMSNRDEIRILNSMESKIKALVLGSYSKAGVDPDGVKVSNRASNEYRALSCDIGLLLFDQYLPEGELCIAESFTPDQIREAKEILGNMDLEEAFRDHHTDHAWNVFDWSLAAALSITDLSGSEDEVERAVLKTLDEIMMLGNEAFLEWYLGA
jgi:hypothetical protein